MGKRASKPAPDPQVKQEQPKDPAVDETNTEKVDPVSDGAGKQDDEVKDTPKGAENIISEAEAKEGQDTTNDASAVSDAVSKDVSKLEDGQEDKSMEVTPDSSSTPDDDKVPIDSAKEENDAAVKESAESQNQEEACTDGNTVKHEITETITEKSDKGDDVAVTDLDGDQGKTNNENTNENDKDNSMETKMEEGSGGDGVIADSKSEPADNDVSVKELDKDHEQDENHSPVTELQDKQDDDNVPVDSKAGTEDNEIGEDSAGDKADDHEPKVTDATVTEPDDAKAGVIEKDGNDAAKTEIKENPSEENVNSDSKTDSERADATEIDKELDKSTTDIESKTENEGNDE